MKNKRGQTAIEYLVVLSILFFVAAAIFKGCTREENRPETVQKSLFKFNPAVNTYLKPTILTDLETGQEYLIVYTYNGVAITPRLK